MRMPKSFLVKKKEDLIVHINYTEEMEIIQKRMERQLDALDIKIPTVLPEKVLPKSSPLKEKDSLHKFAIAKMLGITEDDVPQSKKAKTERLDENCNRVVPNSSHTDRAFDLSLKPSEGIAMVDPATKHMRGMDAKVSQRSPNGSPSEPPKMFEPFPWPHPMLHPHPHAFPPFIPFGMRYANMHATFPYPSLADNCFGYKPFPEHLVAMKALLTPPQTRFPQGPLIPLSPQNSDKVIEGSRSDSNFQGKLINSAFDPVISSYSVFTPEKHSIDLGGKKKERELEPTRYHCDGCSKVYATFSGLSKHKQFHCASQVKKEFSCKYCEKTYVSLGALKMHIRTHTLPCKCKLCGKAFSRPWLLQGHIRTHTGEKPFRCDHCARAFADRSNLRAHLQTHSDIKKYSCKACSKTFSRMSLLLKHEDNCCAGHTVT